MVGCLHQLEIPLRAKIVVRSNFQETVLGRYLELRERSRYRNVAKLCFLSIPHKKSTVADVQTQFPSR